MTAAEIHEPQAPAADDRHEKVRAELAELHVRWRNERPYGSDAHVAAFLREHRPDISPWDRWALWEGYDELIARRDGLTDGSVHWSQVIGEDAPGNEFELQAADAIEADIDGIVAEIAGRSR